MIRKITLLGIIGILVGTFLVFPALNLAQQLYVQYPGNCFMAADESYNWSKSSNGNLQSYTYDSYYYCPVNFYVNGLYVKGMSVDYLDNTATGYIRVKLMRRHFPSGAIQTVAEFQSSSSGTPGRTKGHTVSISGKKYINTAYYTYWLEVYFSEGTASLDIASVRIHF